MLVNNAANDQRHKFEDVTVESWDERQATNLRHQFFAIQAVAPMMRVAGGGSIINFGSVSWHSLQGGMPAYTTAKAAVEGLTRGMARDLGPDRIRVNTVIPGWIMTERQITLWLTPEAEKNLMQVQCLKEKLAPADVTRMVLWLASDDSRMCTAQLWVVDAGGWRWDLRAVLDPLPARPQPAEHAGAALCRQRACARHAGHRHCHAQLALA